MQQYMATYNDLCALASTVAADRLYMCVCVCVFGRECVCECVGIASTVATDRLCV